jgi:two-component system KDP operon response regulator KdpE
MKVLLIEDNPQVAEAVSLCFEMRWPDTKLISTAKGTKGLILAETESPDVIILDLGLPDIDGFQVLRDIRSFSDVPVIILTARAEEIDKVRGLELGADDYIAKPFSHIELLARIKAVLRRAHMPELKGEEKPFISRRLTVDFVARQVTVDGKPVKLTPTEYNLLRYLVRNEGKVLSHRALLEKIWGEEYTDATDFLKVYIQRLRDKLEVAPSQPKMLITERGVGYKFVRPA